MKINGKRKAVYRTAKTLFCFAGSLQTTSKIEVANHGSTIQLSRLESLPTELRSHILSSLASLDDLKATAHASPIFYHQYRADRKQILDCILRSTLGDRVFVDAYAVQKSVRLEHPPHLTPSLAARTFMDTYQKHRSQPSTIASECTAADIVGMATFYWSTVGPLMQEIPQRLLHNLDPSLQIGHLSGVERERLLRALYRFQMWCNLYGTDPGAVAGSRSVQPIEMLMHFFRVFEPWEIEEISCIHALFMDMYDHIFVHLKLLLHQLTDHRAVDVWEPRAWVTTDLRDSPFGMDQFRLRNLLLDSLASGGLEFQLSTIRIQTIQPQPPNPRRHRKQLAKHIHPATTIPQHQPCRNTIQDALSIHTQATMRRALDEAQPYWEDSDLEAQEERGRGGAGRFRRDRADAPPLGWVVRWRGRRGGAYGQETPWALRRWGYMFWDWGRLAASGGKEMVSRVGREGGRPSSVGS
ncbi:hypothetical protein B0I37DRAFT_387065 [Chaetomium sp. MPI-CAGE-AT-0009]|nr:hypothetical protein B0I37DRAFT_387065 [Chaetomium sp. MPI-CAGE-AT-0009]